MERREWRGGSGEEGVERREWRGESVEEGVEIREAREQSHLLTVFSFKVFCTYTH